MAKLIKIEKISVVDNTHLYKVSTEDFAAKSFFIGIDLKNKRIDFFKDAKLNSPIGVVDLSETDTKIAIKGIDPRLMWPAIGQAQKALGNNYFPPRIDYCV